MRDANSEYPVQPPQRRTRNPFANDANGGSQSSPGRSPAHQRQASTQPSLPPGGARKMLSISVATGIIVAIINIVFTLINAPLYQQAASYANHPTEMPLNVASSIFWIFVLTSIISLVIYFVAGFITGRVAVARRLGFFAGFLASIVAQVIGFIVGQIPNYPGKINSGISSNPLNVGGGLIAALIILVLGALIAGLLSWLGARLATRRHPYYVGTEE